MSRRLAGSGYVRAPLGAANLYASVTQRHKPSREILGGFCRVCPMGLACQNLSEGAHVISTLKIQESEAVTLIEKIKTEIKKRAEEKAKRMLLKHPKRTTKRYV